MVGNTVNFLDRLALVTRYLAEVRAISDKIFEQVVDTTGHTRLDQWLTQQIQSLSRSRVQKLIVQGAVQLNGVVCDRKQALVAKGDSIRLSWPEIIPYELKAENIPLDILYEDSQLLIINKPAGMVVHPAPGHYTGTLVHALLGHCGEQLTGVGGVQRPGIVHRLDKNTTGAIVVAKTERALHHLQKQIQDKTAKREYLGLVHGAPKVEQGTINQPIGRHPKHRKKMAIVPEEKGGRTAVTHWKIAERLGHHTLMHFQLETGRTHQIRVHSAYLNLPIVGDAEYGSRRSLKRQLSGVKLPGQALHAFRLTLEHPMNYQSISVEAPLPQHWQNLLTHTRRVQQS